MKTIEEVKNYIEKIEKTAETYCDAIPEEFNNLGDAEEWNYYTGYLNAIHHILEFIGDQENG